MFYLNHYPYKTPFTRDIMMVRDFLCICSLTGLLKNFCPCNTLTQVAIPANPGSPVTDYTGSASINIIECACNVYSTNCKLAL